MNLLDACARRLSPSPDRQDPDARPSRRGLLTGAALLSFWGESAARAAGPELGRPPSRNLALVRHITCGLTEAEVNRVNQLGFAGYLEYQLNYEAIDDSALDQRLSTYSTLFMEPWQLYEVEEGRIISELTEATILRSVFSQRQLFQRMVEFWTDHFNIDITNGEDRYLKTIDDREVIRRHALGRFPELLRASAHSPAMLYYLDNYSSIAGNPNENYARELLELHTLGVDGGYTQEDVVEVARCFTGWTYYARGSGKERGKFLFRAGNHDNEPKVVLGHEIPPNGGYNDGLMVLDILAQHPSTARFIAYKLCRWLWSHEPPPWLVDRVAATYTATDGDIRAMVRSVFLSDPFSSIPSKYKRPYHLMVSGLRATGAAISSSMSLRQHLLAAGQHPFYWGPPDGYPDHIDHWVGLILPRWSFGAALLNGNIRGASVDIGAFLQGANTADDIVARIDAALFGGEMPPAEKERIRQYLLPDPPPPLRKRDSLGLAIGSPGYQWY